MQAVDVPLTAAVKKICLWRAVTYYIEQTPVIENKMIYDFSCCFFFFELRARSYRRLPFKNLYVYV